jgi:hypothetical protein
MRTFTVCWEDESGQKGQGTPWQHEDMALRFAAYAARLARGRRRFWVEHSGVGAGLGHSPELVTPARRILTPEALGYRPLFQSEVRW